MRSDTLLAKHLENNESAVDPIPTASSPHHSPLAKYMPIFFAADDKPSTTPDLLPKQFLPLLQLYDRHLENARYQREEPTQQDYEDCLRVVAVIVAAVKKTEAHEWRSSVADG